MKIFLIFFLAIVILIIPFALLNAGNSAKVPGIVILKSLSDKYEPVRFDHSKHSLMAGDCGKCHHQHGNNSAFLCKGCHSVNPAIFKSSVTNNFMACQNCHSSADPANPEMKSLKVAYHSKCFQCHRGMGNVGTDPSGCTIFCHVPKAQKVSMKNSNQAKT